ncbi:type II TA system antitoxin MqsA family protein [Gordonibacter urolithinfaciens]|uniref:type II TA system antitoxin MqsA family protein n=1 Tax=Gordonibacter urolithinfaciens TaxID=1335613 RepID=UPI000B579ADE|nr:type II TA system antitoxin MqsA family protein [Gordonibacter urolithinfaciens]OUO85700.1 XRE family transcriptional regulator [Gordonibacter urolithinfaciens]
MSETVRTVCDACYNEVDAPVVAVCETVDVRGVSVTDEFWYPICPLCGNRIGHAATMDRNFEKMYTAYREARDVPRPDEIVALRRRYGFSQRVFAAILGIGVASVQRYEGGALPSESHAELLRQARDPQILRERLRGGAPRLGERDRERALRAVEQQAASRIDYAVVRLDLLDCLPRTATPETGLRAFDADRLREAVVYLAAHVGNLFVTKLNKVLFYLDFSAYRDEGAGFTGLRYARADYGPVPDQYDLVMAALVDGATLAYREQGDGRVIVARRGADLSAFSPQEVARLDTVAAFANGFATTAELSAYSHEERAWLETPSGEVIGYDLAQYLRLPEPLPAKGARA